MYVRTHSDRRTFGQTRSELQQERRKGKNEEEGEGENEAKTKEGMEKEYFIWSSLLGI